MDPIAIKKAVYDEVARYVNATQFNGPLGQKYKLQAVTVNALSEDANLPDVPVTVSMGLFKNNPSGSIDRILIPIAMTGLNATLRELESGIFKPTNDLVTIQHTDLELGAVVSVVKNYPEELDDYGRLIKSALLLAET